jgi:branched-subunit amino acid ABC-type transport system permease component
MKIALLAIVGFFLGGILGGVAGVALGFLYTTLAHTTSFEGYSGMLVFFTFMPIGAILGGILGGAALAAVALRVNPAPPAASPETENPTD